MLLSRRACVQHCSSASKQPQILRHVHIPTRRIHLTSQQLRLRVSNETETVSQQADLMLQAATSHFAAILDVLKRHDLEGLIPYMAELNVVKAVVRCVSCCRECRFGNAQQLQRACMYSNVPQAPVHVSMKLLDEVRQHRSYAVPAMQHQLWWVAILPLLIHH
jgi:hypothetical protein